MKRFTTLIISFLFGFGMLAMSNLIPKVQAQNGNLQLEIVYDLPDVEFNLYQLATLNEQNEMTLMAPFDQYPINLRSLYQLDGNQQQTLLQTLITYAEQDDTLNPYQTVITKSISILANTIDGTQAPIISKSTAQFTGLTPGIYMVSGESTETEESLYSPSGSIVVVNNESPIIRIKFSRRSLVRNLTIKAFKVWNDHNNINRPKSVTVDLIQDQTVIESVELKEANQWQIEWNDLPAAEYHVIERDVPAGYQVNIEQEGDTYRIENTLNEEPPTSSETTVVEMPPPPTNSTTPPGDNIIPFTGQIWWPIPLLMLGSIIFYMIGNQEEREEHLKLK